MRPRSTVWRAASLAETPIKNLIWEIPLKLAVCYRARRAQKTPGARFRNCWRERRLTVH